MCYNRRSERGYGPVWVHPFIRHEITEAATRSHVSLIWGKINSWTERTHHILLSGCSLCALKNNGSLILLTCRRKHSLADTSWFWGWGSRALHKLVSHSEILVVPIECGLIVMHFLKVLILEDLFNLWCHVSFCCLWNWLLDLFLTSYSNWFTLLFNMA